MTKFVWNNRREIFTQKLKELVIQSLSVSSADGINSILSTKHLLIRIGWILCLLASLGVCLNFIYGTVNSFLDYEVVTSADLINEQYTEFPTVSLCNSNSGFGQTHELYGSEIGLQQSLLGCYFNGETKCFDNFIDYFEPYNDSMYGNCYRFNSGKNFYGQQVDILNSTMSGFQYGLVLDFTIDTNSYLSDFGQLIISIHNRTQLGSSLFNKEIFLSAGSRNDLVLERSIVQKLDYPYNDCLYDLSIFNKNRTIVDYILNSNRTYSQQECLNLCRNLKYIEKSNCNCSANIDQVLAECFSKLQILDQKAYKCSMDFIKNFVNNNRDECLKYCPLECETILYDTSYNIERFPITGSVSKGQFYVKNFTDYDSIQKSYYSLRIYYKSLSYLLISQQPKMELFDLVSNIGGVLGLFLGLSFLSFAEIIIFLLEFSFILFSE